MDKVLNFKELNSKISALCEENSELKTLNSDIMNKKILYESRTNELRHQLINQESKFKRKETQYLDLKQAYDIMEDELQKEKKGNKKL